MSRPRENEPLVFAAHLILFPHLRYHPQECIKYIVKRETFCSGSVIGRLPAGAQRATQWTGQQRLLLQIHHLWYLPSNLVARNWISPPPVVPIYYDGLFPFKGGNGRQLSGYRLRGIIIMLHIRFVDSEGDTRKWRIYQHCFHFYGHYQITLHPQSPPPTASLLTICQNNFGHECVCVSE